MPKKSDQGGIEMRCLARFVHIWAEKKSDQGGIEMIVEADGTLHVVGRNQTKVGLKYTPAHT